MKIGVWSLMHNRLIKHENHLVRVLDERENLCLIVDCLQRSMPRWENRVVFSAWEECPEHELTTMTGKQMPQYGELSLEERRFAHEHFTMIASVLPYLGEERQRSCMISSMAERTGVSKQTIRHYLWVFLVYQDVAALAPKRREQDRQLTQDEKNMRWALNKFFYTRHRNSLNTAYTMMLREKYCDSAGVLLPEYPTIHQFRYFYRKYNRLQTYYISRNGIKSYQKDKRPLLGDSAQAFASAVGVGLLDSTICDIYLIDDSGNLVGRPILTACVDAYRGLCCGYTLSWEGGVYSLRNLMSHVIADKVEWCRRFGISISREDWDCSQLPATLVTDKGSEYQSGTFEQIAELGVTVVNLPSFRPELKGKVEKFFDVIQTSYKKHLKGKGVIEPDFQERGVRDYRRDACLTMGDFGKIVLHCILYYNNSRIIEGFPFAQEMLSAGVEPYASAIWNWSRNQAGANLISCRRDELDLVLLPRTTGKFGRNGLKVNQLRYRNDAYTERYLSGGTAVVAYDPDDVSCVWLLEKREYTAFQLVESRFSGLRLEEAEQMRTMQRSVEQELKADCLQAQIDLAGHIEAIVGAAAYKEVSNLKQVRQTRQIEQRRARMEREKGDTEDE